MKRYNVEVRVHYIFANSHAVRTEKFHVMAHSQHHARQVALVSVIMSENPPNLELGNKFELSKCDREET